MSTMTLPPPAPSAPGDGLRNPRVFANLLPDEVVAARDARRLRQRILIALGGLLVFVLALYGLALIQTAHAKGELSSAQSQAATLAKQERAFAPLVQAQSQAQAIRARLAQLMAGDIQWKDLIETLRKTPRGVTLTSATINLAIAQNQSSSTRTQAGLDVLNQTGKRSIGTLTIAGIADDKNAVAGYVDSLATVPGFAAPFPASVTLSGKVYQFNVSVIVTTDVLGGRFTTQPASQTHSGGK
jgi:Tfp pilus assembly protein PilN